jgi:hypothetical protein
VAFVQSPTGIAVSDIFSDNTHDLSFASPCTPNNVVVAGAYTGNQAGNLSASMTSGAMTGFGSLGGDQGKIELFYKYAQSGDQVVTITTDENGGGGQFGGIGIGEFSEMAQASIEDGSDTNVLTNTTTHPASDTGINTTTVLGVLVSIHAIGTDDVTRDGAATGILLEDDVSGLIIQYRVVTTGPLTAANLTATNTGNADSINILIALKGAAAGRATKNSRSHPLGMKIGTGLRRTPLMRRRVGSGIWVPA